MFMYLKKDNYLLVISICQFSSINSTLEKKPGAAKTLKKYSHMCVVAALCVVYITAGGGSMRCLFIIYGQKSRGINGSVGSVQF